MATPKKGTGKQPQKTGRKTGQLVPQPHGGALLNGMAKNHVPGPGRPKDAVREKLLGIANGKGVDFLRDLMDGKVNVTLIGTCPACREETALDSITAKILMDRISASIDQRLKGLDLSLKYGAGTKDELDIQSHPDAIRFADAYRSVLQRNVSSAVYARIMGEIHHALESE